MAKGGVGRVGAWLGQCLVAVRGITSEIYLIKPGLIGTVVSKAVRKWARVCMKIQMYLESDFLLFSVGNETELMQLPLINPHGSQGVWSVLYFSSQLVRHEKLCIPAQLHYNVIQMTIRKIFPLIFHTVRIPLLSETFPGGGDKFPN